jgi:hypothetical protein
MKKQILILVMALLAISMSNAYGQITCPVPRAIDPTCLSNDALHPLPGVLYNYTINVPTPAGAKEYIWFVTQDKKFIDPATGLTSSRETTSGDFLAAVGTGYNDPANSGPALELTWKSFTYDPAKPVFVVIQVKSTEPGSCSPNNLKVYKIMPVFAFTLDIANVQSKTTAPYETNTSRCISPVISAEYDETSPEGVKYDFGTDTLFYVVTAANFTTSWLPSLQINAINPLETVVSVDWFRPSDVTLGTPEPMPLVSGNLYTATNPVAALDATGTVSTAGECILIRVVIDHTTATTQYEGIADETITVAVDGKTDLASATPKGDLHFSSTVGTAADCGKEDGFNNDIATQILVARPDIQSTTPGVAPNPNPGTFLPIKP